MPITPRSLMNQRAVASRSTRSGVDRKSADEILALVFDNETGDEVGAGDVVVIDPSNERSVKFAAAKGDPGPVVVYMGGLDGESIRCVNSGVIVRVICDGDAITPGDLIVASATNRYGSKITAASLEGVFGTALTSKAGAVAAEVQILLSPSGFGYLSTVPTVINNWTRDSVNGELYPAVLTDQVGIGTADPDVWFHILASGAEARIETGDATDPTLSFKTTNTAHQIDVYLDESDADDILVVGTTLYANDTDTSVGIGTLPAYPLHLVTDHLATGASAHFVIEDAGAVVRTQIKDGGTQQWKLNSGAGEVGQIEVNTPGADPGIVIWTGVPGAYINRWQFANTGGYIDFYWNADGPGTSLVLEAGGNVGIGITNPVYVLDVLSAADNIFRLSDGTVNVECKIVNPGIYATFGVGSAHDLRIRTSNADRITILAGGNTGFGTTNPLAQLHTTEGRIVNTTRIVGDTVLDNTHHVVFCDTDGGAILVTLPAGVDGTYYRIINNGSSGNDVTIDGNAAETVLGALTQTLSDGEILTLVFETTENWW